MSELIFGFAYFFPTFLLKGADLPLFCPNQKVATNVVTSSPKITFFCHVAVNLSDGGVNLYGVQAAKMNLCPKNGGYGRFEKGILFDITVYPVYLSIEHRCCKSAQTDIFNHLESRSWTLGFFSARSERGMRWAPAREPKPRALTITSRDLYSPALFLVS